MSGPSAPQQTACLWAASDIRNVCDGPLDQGLTGRRPPVDGGRMGPHEYSGENPNVASSEQVQIDPVSSHRL